MLSRGILDPDLVNRFFRCLSQYKAKPRVRSSIMFPARLISLFSLAKLAMVWIFSFINFFIDWFSKILPENPTLSARMAECTVYSVQCTVYSVQWGRPSVNNCFSWWSIRSQFSCHITSRLPLTRPALPPISTSSHGSSAQWETWGDQMDIISSSTFYTTDWALVLLYLWRL